MADSHRFDQVDRFTVGTVGPPGQRAFYLQASDGGEQVTLKMEKLQVAALARHLSDVLADLPEPLAAVAGDMDLREPVEGEFAVGRLSVAVDEAMNRVIVQADELYDEEDLMAAAEAASARFILTYPQVAAFAVHAAQLVAAGRPPCRLCGRPLDPEGHVCIKTNGHSPH